MPDRSTLASTLSLAVLICTFGLPADFLNPAMGIFTYSLDNRAQPDRPAVHTIVNHCLNDVTSRGAEIQGYEISANLNACLPFIKFLDHALDILRGMVYTEDNMRNGHTRTLLMVSL